MYKIYTQFKQRNSKKILMIVVSNNRRRQFIGNRPEQIHL